MFFAAKLVPLSDGDAAAAAGAAHLAPDVAALSNLEHAVQRAYWQLKRKYDSLAGV